MIARPVRGEDIFDWCGRLYDQIQPLLRLAGDGRRVVVGDGKIRVIKVIERVVSRGKSFSKDTWTGTPSRWLMVYADGVTPPAYTTKAIFDAWVAGTLVLDNAEIFDLEADDIHAWMH